MSQYPPLKLSHPDNGLEYTFKQSANGYHIYESGFYGWSLNDDALKRYVATQQPAAAAASAPVVAKWPAADTIHVGDIKIKADPRLKGNDWMAIVENYLPNGTSQPASPSTYEDERAAERKRRKDAGECEECGTKREMTVWGLSDCPYHPKPAGPQ